MYRRRQGKMERGGGGGESHKGSFIFTVSLYIVREMTYEGDEENR